MLNFKDHITGKDMQRVFAANYKKNGKWKITVYLNRIHKLTGYKKVAEKINNLFLQEFLCVIMRRNEKDAIPLCESTKQRLYRCPCNFPMLKGMRLKVK